MKRHTLKLLLAAVALTASQTAMSQNPYLPLWEHVPDGEPRVFEDPDNPGKYRAYIIGSHDVAGKVYCGADVRMWSAPVENLTDWRDEGALFTYNVDGQWDIMFAPDLVEVKGKDGRKAYYLYPQSTGNGRRGFVCRSDRPDGPYTIVNVSEDGRKAVNSVLGFDPSVYVEDVADPADPDFATGYRVYGYWGFQHSSSAQLDPATMSSVRPGTKVIDYFLPACTADGTLRDPEGTEYPAIMAGQKPTDFNYFEASSIRKVGNKYVMIYSGYSGKEYGLRNDNSTLRYAYGDTPLGPWRNGGVLVDSRGVVPNEDGSALMATNAHHNTHGSLQEVNGQWYVFYHRPPRGFGFARQAMVAPVTIQCDNKAVADGGKVVIRAYDPYAKRGVWTAKAANGDEYTGAEVTSEGFNIYGLPPYRYYSAGYACFMTNNNALQDAWDVWDDNMAVNMDEGDIVGFKYFGFGGLDKAQKGLLPFEGTRKGDGTTLNIFLTPAADFTLTVMMDGPWANKTWDGKKLGEMAVKANGGKVQRLTLDVSKAVEGLKGKHAIYLVANGGKGRVCVLRGLGFTKAGEEMTCPKAPKVSITMNGRQLDLPATPTRMTHENGNLGYNDYDVIARLQPGDKGVPVIAASADSPDVKIEVLQPKAMQDRATVKCVYNGQVKNYTIHIR